MCGAPNCPRLDFEIFDPVEPLRPLVPAAPRRAHIRTTRGRANNLTSTAVGRVALSLSFCTRRRRQGGPSNNIIKDGFPRCGAAGLAKPLKLHLDQVFVFRSHRIAGAHGFESRAVCAVLGRELNCIKSVLKVLGLLLEQILGTLVGIHHGKALCALLLSFPLIVLLLPLPNCSKFSSGGFSFALGLRSDPGSGGYPIFTTRLWAAYFSLSVFFPFIFSVMSGPFFAIGGVLSFIFVAFTGIFFEVIVFGALPAFNFFIVGAFVVWGCKMRAGPYGPQEGVTEKHRRLQRAASRKS